MALYIPNEKVDNVAAGTIPLGLRGGKYLHFFVALFRVCHATINVLFLGAGL